MCKKKTNHKGTIWYHIEGVDKLKAKADELRSGPMMMLSCRVQELTEQFDEYENGGNHVLRPLQWMSSWWPPDEIFKHQTRESLLEEG